MTWSDASLRKVAELYYLKDKTQDQIAREIFLTRQTVARMLVAAREREIVRIFVGAHSVASNLENTGQKLQKHFPHLREVIIAPGHPDIFSASPSEAVKIGVKSAVAEAAAKRLSASLSNDANVIVGPGEMNTAVVNNIRLLKPLPEMKVFPMNGFINHRATPSGASIVAFNLQQLSGSQNYLLPVPAIVSADDAELVRRLPLVAQTLKLMAEATVVLTNVAVLTGKKLDDIAAAEFIERSLMDKFLKQLKRCSPAGEISGQIFSSQGEEILAPWKTTGFTLQQMKSLSQSNKGTVICAVGADKTRIKAVIAAIRGKLFNVLVTDNATAEKILMAVSQKSVNENSP